MKELRKEKKPKESMPKVILKLDEAKYYETIPKMLRGRGRPRKPCTLAKTIVLL